MKYKNYEAVVEYDEEQNLLKGRVRNIQAIITFYGTTETIHDEFKKSIHDYLDFGKDMHIKPE